MGVSLGDLEQRQIERLRTELAEVLTEQFTVPPFYDFRTGAVLMRPPTRDQREAVAQFLSSVHFAQLEQVEVRSSEVRRFLERLCLRYLEVNEALNRPRFARYLPMLRARAPRAAAEMQRGLLQMLDGAATSFGERRAPRSWAGEVTPQRATRAEENGRGMWGASAAPAAQSWPAVAAAPQLSASPATGGMWSGAADATIPVPAQSLAAYETSSPFDALASGAQSALFESMAHVGEMPTSPLPALPAYSAPSSARPPTPEPAPATAPAHIDLPPDLYELYGDYLRDAPAHAAAAPQAPTAPAWQSQPGAAFDRSMPAVQMPAVQMPAVQMPAEPGRPSDPRVGQTDAMIFWQLRYQVEANIRRASRSYGLPDQTGKDPSAVLDGLRTSGMVDDADLRIAETLLAMTDAVTARGTATLEDYRQALLLYLLYHRSHLGA